MRRRFANEQIDFCDPGRHLASILAAPKHSRALPGASPGVPGRGDPPGDPGACRGRPETLRGRFRDAFRMLLGTTGRPEGVARSILNQFWVLRGSSRQLPGPIWDRFLCQFSHQFRERAGQRMIPLDCQAHKRAGPRASHNDTIGQKNRLAY